MKFIIILAIELPTEHHVELDMFQPRRTRGDIHEKHSKILLDFSRSINPVRCVWANKIHVDLEG